MIPAGGWRSIPEMTAAAAADHGERTAVVDGDRRLTYAELFDRVRRFGGSLVASGAEPGERVGIWAANGLEWVVAALGDAAGGRRGGAGQHEVQGGGGGRRPLAQRGPRARRR